MNIQRHLPQVPQEALATSKDLAIHPSSRFVSANKQLKRVFSLLDQEVALLHQVRYKQKNQHASATWWRHLAGTQRIANRFLGTYEGEIADILSDASSPDWKPVVKVPILVALTESLLRVLLLQNAATSTNYKTLAALQQLLKAALFMPLALSLKAIVARIEGLMALIAEECKTILSVIHQSFSRKQARFQEYGDMLKTLPDDLRSIYSKQLKQSSQPDAAGDAIQKTTSAPPPRLPSSHEASSSQAHPAREEPLSVPTSKSTSPAITDLRLATLKGKTVPAVGDTPPLPLHISTVAEDAHPKSYTKEKKRKEDSNLFGNERSSLSSDKKSDPKKRKKTKKKGDDIDAIFAGL